MNTIVTHGDEVRLVNGNNSMKLHTTRSHFIIHYSNTC